ncbi:hypothetical protein C5167_049203 [Papaver somniferum]|uniref:Uncharacterized protein n=1 Tax=Papaver somniferum TaxID=3469 RepID=A0A4Y7KLJ2_PAPSO|nr:hypothetical protein C5167_049203 [Papaver somniferum]
MFNGVPEQEAGVEANLKIINLKLWRMRKLPFIYEGRPKNKDALFGDFPLLWLKAESSSLLRVSGPTKNY